MQSEQQAFCRLQWLLSFWLGHQSLCFVFLKHERTCARNSECSLEVPALPSSLGWLEEERSIPPNSLWGCWWGCQITWQLSSNNYFPIFWILAEILSLHTQSGYRWYAVGKAGVGHPLSHSPIDCLTPHLKTQLSFATCCLFCVLGPLLNAGENKNSRICYMCLSLSLLFLSNLLHWVLRQPGLYMSHVGWGSVPGTMRLRLGCFLMSSSRWGSLGVGANNKRGKSQGCPGWVVSDTKYQEQSTSQRWEIREQVRREQDHVGKWIRLSLSSSLPCCSLLAWATQLARAWSAGWRHRMGMDSGILSSSGLDGL